MSELRQQFIEFALASGALRFGRFTTKSGRESPYFFNAGVFHRGSTAGRLAHFYAQTLLSARAAGRVEFDLLFGPAYKGITLAATTAVALAELGLDVPFAFNRKEAKDHGEGGLMVGAPLAGRVVIVDDVITDGAAKRESIEQIRAHGAQPVAVLIALDRRERVGPDHALSEHSAVQQLEAEFGLPVLAIATLDDVLDYVDSNATAGAEVHAFGPAIHAYRSKYGVA